MSGIAPRWDVFCRVVDNYGDAAVCWRLSRQLAAEHVLIVRLWIDDLQALHRLNPAISPQAAVQQVEGVDIRQWQSLAASAALDAAEVAIEAFGCGLPEAYEQDHFGGPSWRVAKKMFATASPEMNRATLKLGRDRQMILFEVRPDTFSPAVWGALTWSYVALGRIDDGELAELVESAWRQVAPKRLLKA